jgi:hypothetical protein
MRPLLLVVMAALCAAGVGHAQGRPSEGHGRGARAAAAHPAYETRPAYPPPRGPYGAARPIAAPPFAPYAAPYTPRTNSLGADWREQQEEARQGVRQGQMAPLGRVIAGIRERTPGRQLDVGIEYLGARPVYRVRWMTAHGRRVDYIVDAGSGAILGVR